MAVGINEFIALRDAGIRQRQSAAQMELLKFEKARLKREAEFQERLHPVLLEMFEKSRAQDADNLEADREMDREFEQLEAAAGLSVPADQRAQAREDWKALVAEGADPAQAFARVTEFAAGGAAGVGAERLAAAADAGDRAVGEFNALVEAALASGGPTAALAQQIGASLGSNPSVEEIEAAVGGLSAAVEAAPRPGLGPLDALGRGLNSLGRWMEPALSAPFSVIDGAIPRLQRGSGIDRAAMDDILSGLRPTESIGVADLEGDPFAGLLAPQITAPNALGFDF